VSVQLKIDVQDKEVALMLQALERRMQDMTPLMREIGEIVRDSVMRNFREGRAPDGTPWKPSLRAIVQRGQTLVDTARLRNSITVSPARDHVAVGTNVEYAAVHQFGARKGSFGEVSAKVRAHTRRTRTGGQAQVRAHTRKMRLPWGDIPARPFLGVRPGDWSEIREAILSHVLAAHE
jgi:phage virion morphogenesis protein